MKPKSESERHNRQDWGIVLLILLIGFCCVAGAGQWALRLSPSWNLNSDMESGLDPNTDFMTKPVGYFEPLDAGILTQPAWVKVFLTPGAIFVTGTPPPAGEQASNVPTKATTSVPLTAISVTVATPTTAVPTNTFVWLPPPPTVTPKHGGGGPTDTPLPPPANVDLSINKTNSAAWYAPGSPFTYTITVTNPPAGSSAVTGATVTDLLPGQIWPLGTTWTCAGAGGATCNTPAGSGNINSAVVNLPLNSSVTFTVTVAFNPGVSGPLQNQATVSVPAGYNETNPGNNVSPVTTSNPGVDLRIVKTPGAGSYAAGGPVSYTIDVTNNSAFTVNGVTVTDIFSGQLENITWSCAACPSSGSGNINDTINMAPGATVTYGVSGNARAEARGPLPNTARVTAPAGFVETNPGDESFPTSISGPSEGNINIGGPGGGVTTLPDGGPPLVMVIPPIVANGDGAYDLVFYEMQGAGPLIPPATNPRVDLDWVQIEISTDGVSWQTVFYWGDPGGVSDDNTNVALPVATGPDIFCATEVDNCQIPLAKLYNNNTGIAIDIDAIVPPGNYSWIRITSPASPGGDGSDVDAIEILP